MDANEREWVFDIGSSVYLKYDSEYVSSRFRNNKGVMMKIYLSPDMKTYTLVEQHATPESVDEYIVQLSWKELSEFRIRKSDAEWMEMSGSAEDGFTIMYSDGVTEWMLGIILEDYKDYVHLLKSYIRGEMDVVMGYKWDWQNKVTNDYARSVRSSEPDSLDALKRNGGCLSVLAIALVLAMLQLILDG